MNDGITCPKCGSDKIAEVIYGMPAFDEELEAKINAGEIVLHGCGITNGWPPHPYECRECRFRFGDVTA